MLWYYPYLTYGNLVWGNTYPTRPKKLFKRSFFKLEKVALKKYRDALRKKIVNFVGFGTWWQRSEHV